MPPFDLQPLLVGTLVELRPLTPDDFTELFAVASDPLIWEQHPERERYREEVFRRFFRESLDSGGALVVLDRRDGRIIGSSRYFGYDDAKREVEIGWSFLGRTYWGGRYNGEMKQLMLQHAFRFVDRVIFLIGVNNIRSQRAIERIGGVQAGRRPDVRGRDRFVYEITAAMFASPHDRDTQPDTGGQMLLIREVMYCKPGKVKPLMEKFLAMNKLSAKLGMPKMRVLTDFCAERYWTLVAEMEVSSMAEFEKMMAGGGGGQNAEAMKEMEKLMAGYHDFVEYGKREVYKIEG